MRRIPFKEKFVAKVGNVRMHRYQSAAYVSPFFEALKMMIIDEKKLVIPLFGKFTLKRRMDFRFKKPYWGITFKPACKFKSQMRTLLKDFDKVTNRDIAETQIKHDF